MAVTVPGGRVVPSQQAAIQSPLQFNTTRADNGALTTSTPGYTGPAPQGQGFGDVISKILANRQAARTQAPPANMQMMDRAAAPAQYAQAPQQYSAPSQQFAAAPIGGNAKPEQFSRIVHDPRQSPFAKMATGLEPTAVTEKGYRNPKTGQIEWEFDSERPHGSSGGIIGGGMSNPSSLHSTSSEGGSGPIVPPDMTAMTNNPGQTQTDTGYTRELQGKQKAANEASVRNGSRAVRINGNGM